VTRRGNRPKSLTGDNLRLPPLLSKESEFPLQFSTNSAGGATIGPFFLKRQTKREMMQRKSTVSLKLGKVVAIPLAKEPCL
jgi:hypothetical protein